MKKIVRAFSVLVVVLCSFSSVMADELTNLSIIEKDLFGVEYKNEDGTKRLNRIEKHIFGGTKTGPSAKRIQDIADASGISFMPKKTAEEKRIAAADFEKEDTSVNYPVIDLMENKVFNKNFNGENVYKRVARLEQKAFGKSSEGELSTRTDKLKAAILAVKQDDVINSENSRIATNSNQIKTAEMFRNTSKNGNAFYNQNPTGMYGANSSAMENYDLFGNQKLMNDAGNYQNSRNGGYPTGAAANSTMPYDAEYSSDFAQALSAAENFILGKSNDNYSVGERLNKLENKVFKKTFNGDKVTRLERVVSAASAKKNGGVFNENKWERYLATGIQVGSILLMILAMIL